jgi:glycosyltransferase involved in cell wall biosynthesis
VHDYLLVMRGAERAFAEIASIWPEAPIYTLLYSREGTGGHFDRREVRTSYLHPWAADSRRFRAFLPAFPSATERLNLASHDLVISSSSAFAHGVRVGEGATHVCYCYTPFRYAWHERERVIASASRYARPMISRTLDRIREWDLEAARSVTHYIAISELARRRIAERYGREAGVVHPPVDVDRFQPLDSYDEFFLVVGQLVKHKRVDVALEAAERVGAPIRVVGDGPDRKRLERRYRQATFLGRVSDRELEALYPRAKALVMPNVEEFGITAVESQAAGRPVLALRAGGAEETVLDGTTGTLLTDGTVEAFAEAMYGTDFDAFDGQSLRAHAEQFSRQAFRANFSAELDRVTAAADRAHADTAL